MKVSVVLPYYNGGKYIKEQLDSILKQLGSMDEVIVSIDRAMDGSMEVLKQYAKVDKRVRLLQGPQRGVVKNIQYAAKAASGDIIFMSDQDDVWLDHKVEKVMEAFSHPNIVAVLHNAQIVDENLKKTGQTTFEWRDSKPGFLKNFFKNSYIGACMAFRSELKKYIFPIPKKIFMHDYWIGARAEEVGEVAFLEEPLLLYRRHSSNVTALEHDNVRFMVRKRFYILVETLKWKAKRVKSKKSRGQKVESQKSER